MMRILTLNINGFGTKHGAWPQRRSLLVELLATTQPQIAALQAVRREEGTEMLDQASQLAASLPGYEAFFQPAKSNVAGEVDGLAFLSHQHPAMVHMMQLSRPHHAEDMTDRILLHGRFDRDGHSLHIFNAYVSWVENQAAENVREILAYLGSFEGPRLLLGDFNNAPDAKAMKEIEHHGWEDVWQRFHPDQDGWTFVENGHLCKRIDYVWASGLGDRLRGIDLVGEPATNDGIRISDHSGLLVSIE